MLAVAMVKDKKVDVIARDYSINLHKALYGMCVTARPIPFSSGALAGTRRRRLDSTGGAAADGGGLPLRRRWLRLCGVQRCGGC